jgi:thiol-disulfide isomerase/thioredoxin
LKDGYDRIDFSFPNTSEEKISINDDRFKNKVLIVQLMGTWCPNCLDESKYYAQFYKNNRDKNIEIIALAFEYSKTKKEAFNRIDHLKNKIGINYTVLLAQYGTDDKAKALEKLPMLEHVISYPTSIFIDKTGKVRKIHTGFNGPATGEKYVEFKAEFEAFVTELLAE